MTLGGLIVVRAGSGGIQYMFRVPLLLVYSIRCYSHMPATNQGNLESDGLWTYRQIPVDAIFCLMLCFCLLCCMYEAGGLPHGSLLPHLLGRLLQSITFRRRGEGGIHDEGPAVSAGGGIWRPNEAEIGGQFSADELDSSKIVTLQVVHWRPPQQFPPPCPLLIPCDQECQINGPELPRVDCQYCRSWTSAQRQLHLGRHCRHWRQAMACRSRLMVAK